MQSILARATRAIALVCLLGSTAACATITRGVHETWTVDTDPGGAQVKTSNGFACDQTPCTFRMERKTEFDVTISKAGYKPYHGHVTHSVSGAGGAGMAGNVLVGGIIGVGVDATSGAMMDLKPNPLKVTLEKETVADAAPAASPAPAQAMADAAAPAPAVVPASTTAPAPAAAPADKPHD